MRPGVSWGVLGYPWVSCGVLGYPGVSWGNQTDPDIGGQVLTIRQHMLIKILIIVLDILDRVQQQNVKKIILKKK